MKHKVIHITGASGSGTTTLAKAICEKYGHTHLDSDDFFWEQTDPPFTVKRPVAERQQLMSDAMDACAKCVISGSLTGWGDVFIPDFELVIYLETPTKVRLKRLEKREAERFGGRILPGGDMEDEHQQFLIWASQYDNGGIDMRSAAHHTQWLKNVTCPIIKMDGSVSIAANLSLFEQM